METLKVFEAFSGIGAQHRALSNANINFEVIGTSDIDKNAEKAYATIHGNHIKNYGDICKIDPKQLPEFDFITYSFPCQALSSAGKQGGLQKGSGTTSSLLWEIERFVKETHPKYLLMENVKAIKFKKHTEGYNAWKKLLEDEGYVNHELILNSADFGVAQARTRVFLISFRKDVAIPFSFSYTPKHVKFGDIREEDVKPPLYDVQPFMIKAIENGEHIITNDGLTRTLTTKMERKQNGGMVIDNNYSCGYRYMTPLEAMRLMGFNDSDYQKLTNANFSKGKIYKLMGNSIVVPVLEAIFKNMFPNYINS